MKYDDFVKKMEEKFSTEKYEIIYAGQNSSERSVIKCLSCNKIVTINTGELFRNRKKFLCSNCNSILRKDTIKNREIVLSKIKEKGYNIEFFMSKQSENGNSGDMVRFACLKCENINTFFVGNIIKNNSNVDCKYCSGQKISKDHIIFKQELEERYPNKFTLLTNYVDVKHNIKVRCNDCNFIRVIKPAQLLRSGYCPKCGKNGSKGEERVREWLESNNIKYETQKYFKEWDIGIHYFDFYLPEYNTIIEYHGIQHYSYNPYFHKTVENYEYRKEKDELKKNKAIEKGINYISIKYTNFNKIEKILDSIFQGSTTISKESRGKCLEIVSFQQEEDIV